MTRFALVLILALALSLALVPNADALPHERGEIAVSTWQNVLSDLTDWLLSWLPFGEPAKQQVGAEAGILIDPSGQPSGPEGQQAYGEHGILIDPSGQPSQPMGQQACGEHGLLIDPSGQPCPAL